MYKNTMKMFMASTAFAVVVVSVAAPIPADAATKVFKDVPTSHHYYKEISEMTSKGIINGYPEDNSFRPNELITRQHAASLLVRAFKPDTNHNRVFKDMSKGSAHYKNMEVAVALGWLDATNGNVRPNEPITRGDMAVAITKAAKLYSQSQPHGLKDVSNKYEHAVKILYNSKVTTGYEDKTFREREGLSRVHYSVFMYRAMEFKEEVKESNKGTMFGDSIISKYERHKVPAPAGVTYDTQFAEYQKLATLVPSGGYKALLPGYDLRTYEGSLNRIKEVTGTEVSTLAKLLEGTIPTGKLTYFTGTNGKKYFIGFLYFGDSIIIGEDHR